MTSERALRSHGILLSILYKVVTPGYPGKTLVCGHLGAE